AGAVPTARPRHFCCPRKSNPAGGWGRPCPGTAGTTESEAPDLRPRGTGQTPTSNQPLNISTKPPRTGDFVADLKTQLDVFRRVTGPHLAPDGVRRCRWLAQDGAAGSARDHRGPLDRGCSRRTFG